MGFWDVLLFTSPPSWGRAGSPPQRITAHLHQLVVLAAMLSFAHGAHHYELSTAIPLKAASMWWSKEAFGDFHGFVAAGPTGFTRSFIFWTAHRQRAMSVYIGGPKFGKLASNPHYLLWASLGCWRRGRVQSGWP